MCPFIYSLPLACPLPVAVASPALLARTPAFEGEIVRDREDNPFLDSSDPCSSARIWVAQRFASLPAIRQAVRNHSPSEALSPESPTRAATQPPARAPLRHPPPP